MRSLHYLSFYFASACYVAAQYTIYQPKDQVIFGGTNLHLTATASAASAAPAAFTAGAAYDKTVLNPPAVPNPAIPVVVPIQLPSTGGFQNMSPPVPGAFMGFSIEMSVSNQVCASSSFFVFEHFGKRTTQWARTGTRFFALHHAGHSHLARR
jgi:hypothetical protein